MATPAAARPSTPAPVPADASAYQPRAERHDLLGQTLARSVRARQATPDRAVLQRYRVSPLPVMTHQWRLGLGLFFDPNCGWYAQVAAMRQRAAALGMAQHFPADPKRLLPKTTWLAFDPDSDGAPFASPILKPTSLAGWDQLLQTRGPIIVSGKLGAADWGDLGDLKLGVGHYILIVGADTVAGTLDYLDPLQGDVLRSHDYAHLDARIQPWVSHIEDDALMARIAELVTN